MTADKAKLRDQMKARLAGLPAGQVERESNELCRGLVDFLTREGARVVMVYAPLPGEADVRGVAAALAMSGGRVCLPRVDWRGRSMRAVEVGDWAGDLEPVAGGPAGLLAPRAGLAEVAAEGLDAVLVPGLAFDAAGGRLGRGAGFYDRFLAGLPARVRKVGVALAAQVSPSVPMEAHDVKMDWLATPTGVARAGPKRGVIEG